MDVFGSLQLDHRQPSAVVDGEQVQHAAVGGGEGGNLAVDGRGEEAGVDLLDVSSAPAIRARLRGSGDTEDCGGRLHRDDRSRDKLRGALRN